MSGNRVYVRRQMNAQILVNKPVFILYNIRTETTESVLLMPVRNLRKTIHCEMVIIPSTNTSKAKPTYKLHEKWAISR